MAVQYSEITDGRESSLSSSDLPPLTDAIIIAVGRLVDDSQYGQRREPSHSMIEAFIRRAGLIHIDPHQDKSVGKEKRVNFILGWCLDNDALKGRIFLRGLLSCVQGSGGFRPESPNYVPAEAIDNARAAFKTEGWYLAPDGDLRPILLGGIGGAAAEGFLRRYIDRLRKNPDDSPLVIGTSKDLLEATAEHVIVESGGTPSVMTFPALLGMAFTTVGLATDHTKREPGEPKRLDVERQLYMLGCAVSRLRNRAGSGHGHIPGFLEEVSREDARAACIAMAAISERLLDALRSR